MKTIIRNFSIAVVASLTMSGCNDVLDINNTKEFGDVAVWSSQNNADAYVTAAYKTFNDQGNLSSRAKYYDNYSDLSKSPMWWVEPFNQALLDGPNKFITGSADLFDCWSATYGRIKRTNQLLNDLERYGTKWGDEWYTTRRAEARFCNAINYFFLARVYGGVVLRTDHSGGNGWMDDGAYESDRNRARISEAETYKYILDELQWCADNLPEEWPSAWTGRATKGIAYAFISRIALYAGEWQMALDAALECDKRYDLVDNYAKLFDVGSGQDNSKEVIFKIQYEKNVIKNGFDADNRPYYDRTVYDHATLAYAQPTAELVDMYEFKDGTDFDWNTYKTQGHADPYTDREPRFHATVLYDGAKWEERTIETFVDGTDGYVDFDLAKDADGHTVTGYYIRKYLQEGNTSFPTEGSYNTDIVIRYGEVLLNKAEALAMLNDVPEALKALNKVRERVDLPAKSALTVDEFMKLLRHERCVELAGEGLRIWDLKRWKLAEATIHNKTVHAHKITVDADGNKTYTTVDADGGLKRVFLSKYYYLSLPSLEISQNSLCKNNPGW